MVSSEMKLRVLYNRRGACISVTWCSGDDVNVD